MAQVVRWIGRGFLGLLALICSLTLISTLSNIGLPHQSETPERLSALEKARLAETLHLRASTGDAVWPGFGSAGIPVLLWNETYAFLVNHPSAPARWETVPDDDFLGHPYYRRTVTNPQAFAELVDGIWVGSMSTGEWTPIALQEEIREDLPAFLRPIFPFRLVTRIYSTDFHIAAVLHESFHAYQAQTVPEQLAAAENALHQYEATYPCDSDAFQTDWAAEMRLLQRAVQAETEDESVALIREFLTTRTARRQRAALSDGQTDYERQREWLEGTAKYVELRMWQAGATTNGYTPVSDLAEDPDFNAYTGIQKRFDEEIKQITRVRLDRCGDGRFYYSGMAQGLLLDRVAPGWKEHAFVNGVWLEVMLAVAVDE